MATLKELQALVLIELPNNRREVIGITIPSIPGLNSAANKAWHIQKQLDAVCPFHTEDVPLNQHDVNGLKDPSILVMDEYKGYFSQVMTIKAWVENGVEQQ